jgi:hypothetical protein
VEFSTLVPGSQVVVKKPVLPHEKSRYAGRSGVVVRLNGNSHPRKDTGLWYVRLDATDRAIETTETFWGSQLAPSFIPLPGVCDLE